MAEYTQMKNILSIAGFDPSSGAGITKDLDIFVSHGFHAMLVPTSMVIQGPQGVRDAFPVPLEQFSMMLDVAGNDVSLSGVKIGVIWDSPYIARIATFLKKVKNAPVVLDPVLSAKNGKALITEKGIEDLKNLIFPKTTVVTPNTEEASALTGMSIAHHEDMEESAKRFVFMGCKAAVIKGGHLAGDPVDMLYDGQEFTRWQRRRSDKIIHGTGCIFSSLLLSFLAAGYPLREAFLAAEEGMDDLLEGAYHIDRKGYHYTSPSLLNSRDGERFRVLAAMKQAHTKLLELNPVDLVPEVQLNVGYATPRAKGIEDIAAFPGRIGRHQGRLLVKGEPEFGASSHVALMILASMARFPFVRSAANLRYSEATIEKALKQGMNLVSMDRRKARKKIKDAEGDGLDFIVKKALERAEAPPDVIYDVGDRGKEPIIRLFARNPLELITKMEKIRP